MQPGKIPTPTTRLCLNAGIPKTFINWNKWLGGSSAEEVKFPEGCEFPRSWHRPYRGEMTQSESLNVLGLCKASEAAIETENVSPSEDGGLAISW
jgi:hypothetical protein